jgi:predicted transcriptional regulator
LNKTPRRGRLQLYGDILAIIESEGNEKIVLTHIQLKIQVPFDRLKKYLSEMKTLGYIDDEKSPKLTQKGKQYKQEYIGVIDFMKRMGAS